MKKYPYVVPSLGQLDLSGPSPGVADLTDHRIYRTIVVDLVPVFIKEPPLDEVAHKLRAGVRGKCEAGSIAVDDLVVSLERDAFHDIVQRAIFDVRAFAVEADRLPPFGFEREVRALIRR